MTQNANNKFKSIFYGVTHRPDVRRWPGAEEVESWVKSEGDHWGLPHEKDRMLLCVHNVVSENIHLLISTASMLLSLHLATDDPWESTLGISSTILPQCLSGPQCATRPWPYDLTATFRKPSCRMHEIEIEKLYWPAVPVSAGREHSHTNHNEQF